MEKYKLPFHMKSSLKWYMNALYLFCTLATAAGSILFFVGIMKDELILGFLMGLVFLLMSLFFGYIYLFTAVLKKFYIEMTTEYIKVHVLSRTKMAYWGEIHDVYLYSHNNNTFIGILLDKDRNKKAKRTVSNNFNSLYGIPPTSFQIPLSYFGSVDIERLLRTMDEQIDKNDTKDFINIENSYKDDEEENSSILKAIIASVMVSIAASVVYAFTIYKIEKNYVAIPIFGSFLIILVFNKYYVEEKFSLFIRLLLGIICLIQVPAAIIGAVIFSESNKITVDYVLNLSLEYFRYLVHKPADQIVVIIVAVICFAFGAIKGCVR